jgi:uncharacterized cupredoxin-like copper-binding protein
VAIIVALVWTLMAGCASSPHTSSGRQPGSSGMMGQRSGFGGPMMAPGGYHLSRLTCAEPRSLPGTVVHVMLGDMGMTHLMGGTAPMGSRMMLRAVPTEVPHGTISFVIGNMGWRTHEMVVLPLTPGQPAGQRLSGANGRVDETGSLGEASASCGAGSGEGIEAGTAGWDTLDLAAGRYELLCNLRNHYANGMYQLLVVS